MEKYSKAVREMYSQFKKREARPMEKYVGRFVNFYGVKLEVVGYSRNELSGKPLLIVDTSRKGVGGWNALEPSDVIFKECESYWYANINRLIE